MSTGQITLNKFIYAILRLGYQRNPHYAFLTKPSPAGFYALIPPGWVWAFLGDLTMLHIIAVYHRMPLQHWRLTQAEYDSAFDAFTSGDDDNDLGLHDLAKHYVIKTRAEAEYLHHQVRDSNAHQWPAIQAHLSEIKAELA